MSEQRISGKFKPGQSGNPGGRPKQCAAIRKLARERAELAIERLAHWAQCEDPQTSIAASAALLDLGSSLAIGTTR